MSMIITPNLHFNGNCEEAIYLYKQAFNVEIICLLKNTDANTQYSSCFVSLIDKYGIRWELMTEQTEK